VDCIEVLSVYFLGERRNHKNLAIGPRFEPTYDNHYTTLFGIQMWL
jgi:hypothetical protein